jgi:hypothetical protein
MNPAAQYLRDVHGPDPVGWWPPALGWWLVALAVVLGVFALVRLYRWWRKTRFSLSGWRWDARRRLIALRRRVTLADLKAVAGELSELLRRIAIARCGRDTCAGLSGEAWLQWLSLNDPRGFDWNEQGRLLLELPYSPYDPQVSRQDLLQLIDAALEWVKIGSGDPSKERCVVPGPQAPAQRDAA